MADTKLTALPELTSIALDDWIYLIDSSDATDDAAGSSRKAAIRSLFHFCRISPHGRLTTESGVADSTSDRTGQSTLYYTPYNGNLIWLYTGSIWRPYTFTERSLTLVSLTSGKNYDVFLYDNSGTLTLELSAAWTSDTARSDALVLQDGILVKSGAATRRWLGTIRTTSTSTTQSTLLKRFVWNAFNQIDLPMSVSNSNVHSYSGPEGVGQYANSDSNQKFEWVNGGYVPVNLGVTSNTTSGGWLGIGIDWTSGLGVRTAAYLSTGSAQFPLPDLSYVAAGYHYAALVETRFGAVPTFYAQGGVGWIKG